jgi:hypothetical protein
MVCHVLLVEHTPNGEKWGIRRGQGTRRNVAWFRADLAAGAHPRPRLLSGRRRPPLGAALRRPVFHHGTVDGTAPMPRALAAFEWVVAFDRKMVQQNHADLFMVSSHDRTQYEQAKATA